jgi:hypothetical protein
MAGTRTWELHLSCTDPRKAGKTRESTSHETQAIQAFACDCDTLARDWWVLKTGVGAIRPWVRIPPSPPNKKGPVFQAPFYLAVQGVMTPTGVRLCRSLSGRFHSPPIIGAACRRQRRWVRRVLADIPPRRSHPPTAASPAAGRSANATQAPACRARMNSGI